MLRPVELDDELIGQPLPWDLYTASGVLMAGSGTVIADAAHLQRLRAQELFRQSAEGSLPGSFSERLETLAEELALQLSEPYTPLLGAAAEEIADTLLSLHRHDAEACLGLTRLIPIARPAIRHCLLAALVTASMAEAQDHSDRESVHLMAAALSMNVSEMALHDALAQGFRSMGEAERQALRTHPQRSAAILEANGVDDPLWLSAVRAHHEHMDGSGYPDGLQGADIPTPARMLRVADYYCAKLGSRHYRPPRGAEQALKEIFGSERTRLDNHFVTLLLRRLGTHPPGTLVRLANRETAVVARCYGRNREVRKVVSFLDYREQPMERPAERDITQRAYAMAGTAERTPDWPAINWEQLWGY